MAITYGTPTYASTGGTGPDLTITVPSISDGQLLLAGLLGVGSSLTDAWDALSGDGFTQIHNKNETAGRNLSLAVGYKVASSEPSDHTFTLGSTSGIDRCGFLLPIISQHGDVLDVTFVEGTHYVHAENDPTPDPASITTLTANAEVITIAGVTGAALTPVVPSGHTSRAATNGGANRNLNASSKLVASPGAENPDAWANTGGDSTAESAVVTLAIKPAAGGGGGIAAAANLYHNVGKKRRRL